MKFLEDEYTEFKKTTGELANAMVDICAMLNKHGKGIVYFGINNDGSPHKFDISDKTMRDISRKVYESIRPQIYPKVSTVSIEGNEAIVVEFSGTDYPYSANGKYYLRTADENHEISPAELRHIMIAKEYEMNWEQRKSSCSIEDVDEVTLKWFYESGLKSGRLPQQPYGKEEILQQLNLVSDGYLNNAGELLFSSKGPLVLKMAVFATDEKITFLDIKREEGNIFQLINIGLKYIVENIRWRVEITGLQRTEIPEIPIDAIREILVNSFAHAQYSSGIQHEIDVFKSWVSITNPGSFANSFTPEDYYLKIRSSVLRNKLIANVLYRCKDFESFGSGLKKVYSLCEDSKTQIKYDMGNDYFTFSFGRNQSNVVINVVKDVVLTESENVVLNLIRRNPEITAELISHEISKTPRTAQRILDSLKAKGMIKRFGNRKNGYWEVL